MTIEPSTSPQTRTDNGHKVYKINPLWIWLVIGICLVILGLYYYIQGMLIGFLERLDFVPIVVLSILFWALGGTLIISVIVILIGRIVIPGKKQSEIQITKEKETPVNKHLNVQFSTGIFLIVIGFITYFITTGLNINLIWGEVPDFVFYVSLWAVGLTFITFNIIPISKRLIDGARKSKQERKLVDENEIENKQQINLNVIKTIIGICLIVAGFFVFGFTIKDGFYGTLGPIPYLTLYVVLWVSGFVCLSQAIIRIHNENVGILPPKFSIWVLFVIGTSLLGVSAEFFYLISLAGMYGRIGPVPLTVLCLLCLGIGTTFLVWGIILSLNRPPSTKKEWLDYNTMQFKVKSKNSNPDIPFFAGIILIGIGFLAFFLTANTGLIMVWGIVPNIVLYLIPWVIGGLLVVFYVVPVSKRVAVGVENLQQKIANRKIIRTNKMHPSKLVIIGICLIGLGFVAFGLLLKNGINGTLGLVPDLIVYITLWSLGGTLIALDYYLKYSETKKLYFRNRMKSVARTKSKPKLKLQINSPSSVKSIPKELKTSDLPITESLPAETPEPKKEKLKGLRI